MTPQEIIAECDGIYGMCLIPPNLGMHMKRVAAVAAFIADHWKGPALDRDTLLAACLVHDLGNLVKSDFTVEIAQRLMGDEWERVEYWKRVQADLVKRFGHSEFDATVGMLEELGAPGRIKELIRIASFSKNRETLAGNDWERKLLAQADHLVGPFGVLTLQQRLDEAEARYANRKHLLGGSDAVKAAWELQEQIAANMTVPLSELTDANVEPYVQRFSRA